MLSKTGRKLLAGLVPLMLCLPGAATAQRGTDGPPAKVAPSCAAAQLSCTVGERRVYDYAAVFTGEADVVTNTAMEHGSATFTGASQVTMTAVQRLASACTYEVLLENVEVAEYVRGEETQTLKGEEAAAAVGAPFYFTQTDNGQITEVVLGRELQPEAANFKRGVVNALNVTLLQGDAYQVTETDMAGTFLADYRVSYGEQTLVERERRTGESLGKSVETAYEFTSSQSASVTIDPGSCVITQVNIDETVIIDAPDSSDPPVGEHFRHETLTVNASANMTLTSSGIVKTAGAPSMDELERRGMVRLPVNAAVTTSPDALDNGPAIDALLAQLQSDPANKQLVRELSRAVRSSADGVGHLARFIQAHASAGKLARTVGSQLISLGTVSAQDLLVDSFLQGHHAADVRERLIGLSTLIEQPSPRLVRAAQAIARDYSAPDYATATLALGAYADRLRTGQPGLAAKLDAGLMSRLQRASSADDTVLALRALGNAGAKGSLPAIARHLGSRDMVTRASAAVALRKIDSPEVDRLLLRRFERETSRSVKQAIQRVLQERIDNGLSEATPALKTVIIDWSWSETFGGNVANATFSASALVEDEPYLVDLQAGAVGEVFNNDFTILDVQLLTEEVNAQDRRFRFFIDLAGNTIANIDDTETCSIAATDTLWDESIELLDLSSPSIPIIGPLTLKFTVELSVEFYVNFFRSGDWCTANSELDMGITPGVALDADGYATLSLIFVRGGVGVAGTLIGIEFPVYAGAEMLFQDASTVCFNIDAQLLVADMELYAWGQYWTFWSGWSPDPKPKWTLWSFNLNPEAWTLYSLCESNPSLNCLPDVLWWDGSTIDAWFDGANCFVTTPPPGNAFIANNSYYLEIDSNCPAGMPWDGTGCLEANVAAFPGIGVSLSTAGGNARLTFYKFGIFGPIPSCPSGWTTTSYVPGQSRVCERTPPAGYSASDFFMVSANSYQYTIYLDGTGSCSAGIADSTGCWLGNAPGGTNAFLWSGNFYYSEP